jgi:ADP-ribosylglycohydrolase
MKRSREFFRGCLVGGAIGDALGWPIEFMKHDEIKRKYGNNGIQDLVLEAGIAQITDDTQMTLFTAEGILCSQTKRCRKGICDSPLAVFYSYQRWLITQGYPRFMEYDLIYNGWLLGIKELYARRAPGNSCLSALSSHKQGSIREPVNNSKGCGGIMRVAPTGLFYRKETAFDMAVDFAALTHGHPSGYFSAGALAYLIASIIDGQNIETGVKNTLSKLENYDKHEECSQILRKALDLSKNSYSDIEAISQLGEGWVGEEALGISVYCALKHQDDFKQALIAAVNHNGDSDSTGAITGNIVGAYLGLSNIPKNWLEKVEFREILMQISDDLLIAYQENQEWWDRYPGY